jgi:hypothetical protein
MLMLIAFRLQVMPGFLAQMNEPGWEQVKSLGLPAMALIIGAAAVYRWGVMPLSKRLDEEIRKRDELTTQILPVLSTMPTLLADVVRESNALVQEWRLFRASRGSE